MGDLRKVGINGFGRIGSLLYQELKVFGLDVEHINEPRGKEAVVQAFPKKMFVEDIGDGNIRVDGKEIIITDEKNPSQIPWKDVGIVEECSGRFKTYESASLHKARHVILSGPPEKGQSIPIILMGNNHLDLNPDYKVISNGSCTTKSGIAIKVLKDNGFKISTLLLDTVHSATNSMQILGALDNIQIHSTGAKNAIPQAYGVNVSGAFSYRVPTSDGSFSNFVFYGGMKDHHGKEYVKNMFLAATGDREYITAHEKLVLDKDSTLKGEELEAAIEESLKENRERYLGRIDVINENYPDLGFVVGNPASGIIVLPLMFYNSWNNAEDSGGGEPAYEDYAFLMKLVVGYDNELNSAYDQAMLTKYLIHKIEGKPLDCEEFL